MRERKLCLMVSFITALYSFSVTEPIWMITGCLSIRSMKLKMLWRFYSTHNFDYGRYSKFILWIHMELVKVIYSCNQRVIRDLGMFGINHYLPVSLVLGCTTSWRFYIKTNWPHRLGDRNRCDMRIFCMKSPILPSAILWYATRVSVSAWPQDSGFMNVDKFNSSSNWKTTLAVTNICVEFIGVDNFHPIRSGWFRTDGYYRTNFVFNSTV